MNVRVAIVGAAVMAGALLACSDSDGSPGCDAPITVVPGTWCITITASDNTCSRPTPPPYAAEFTQDGNAIGATSFGATYAGTLCGSTATMSGDVPGMTVSVDLTFSDASHVSGLTTWSGSGCSGTDTFTGSAGTCS